MRVWCTPLNYRVWEFKSLCLNNTSKRNPVCETETDTSYLYYMYVCMYVYVYVYKKP